MFGDDVALWVSIYTGNEREMKQQLILLQQSLDAVSLWSSRWKMLLAPDKTQSITFKMKNETKFPKMNLQLNNISIEETKQVKYLGLILDNKMTYRPHQLHLWKISQETWISDITLFLPRHSTKPISIQSIV